MSEPQGRPRAGASSLAADIIGPSELIKAFHMYAQLRAASAVVPAEAQTDALRPS